MNDNDKKWASNDKDRLLVENFKKFVNEYDEKTGNVLDAAADARADKYKIKDKLERHENFDDSWMYDMPEWDTIADAAGDPQIPLGDFREMVNEFIAGYFPN